MHVEMIADGRWIVAQPDGSNASLIGQTFASMAAARRAMSQMERDNRETLHVINCASENKFQ